MIARERYRLKKFRYEVVPGLWLPGLCTTGAMSGRVPAVVNLNEQGDVANAIQSGASPRRKDMLTQLQWFGMGEMAAIAAPA
jgi:hypothetical protein